MARQKYITPQGTLGWVSLQEPDTKFVNEEDPNDKGVYKAMLRLPKDAPETQEFLGKIQRAFDEFVEEQSRIAGRKIKVHEDGMPWSDEEDRETGEPTGNVLIRTKLKAYVFSKKTGRGWPQRPKIFDAKGRLIPQCPNIGPGSTVRVSGQMNPWFTSKAGITLWCEAVQVIDLVESNFGGDTADAYGFDEQDGFESPTDHEIELANGGSGNF